VVVGVKDRTKIVFRHAWKVRTVQTEIGRYGALRIKRERQFA
jgi:hypothetical protein